MQLPIQTKDPLRRLTLASLFCALIFLATALAIPLPLGGNVNLGDAMILISTLLFPDPILIFAAAIGSSLSDFAFGFAIYIPATAVLKACIVILSLLLRKVSKTHPAVAFALAELVMVAGYYLWEAVVLLHSFVTPLANVPFNLVQASVAVLFSSLFAKRIRK